MFIFAVFYSMFGICLSVISTNFISLKIQVDVIEPTYKTSANFI